MKYAVFSPRSLLTMTWWQTKKYRDKDAIICDGSIRSSKTVSMSIGFILWTCSCFHNQTFAICGKTIESLRRNVITQMPTLFEGLCKITERKSENLMVVSLDGRVNKYYLFGGKDEGSAALIQGMTLAGVMFDEVALMPRSFVEQALARCSVEGSKFWFNCNPDNPQHWFYQEWIEKHKQKNALYLHFTMADNYSLSEKIKKRYENMYSGVFYDRFILGKWVAAEGVIYGLFANDKNRYTIGSVNTYLEESNQTVRLVSFGVDFGGNRSATSFTATLITNTGAVIIADEAYIKKELNPDTLNMEYAAFIERNTKLYGAGVTRADSAESVLIRGLDLTAKKQGLRTKVKLALKRPINDRIKITLLLMAQDRLKICKNCIHTVDAFASAVYDEKKLEDIRLDDGNMNIDSLDSFEYSIEPYIEQIEHSCLKRRD